MSRIWSSIVRTNYVHLQHAITLRYYMCVCNPYSVTVNRGRPVSRIERLRFISQLDVVCVHSERTSPICLITRSRRFRRPTLPVPYRSTSYVLRKWQSISLTSFVRLPHPYSSRSTRRSTPARPCRHELPSTLTSSLHMDDVSWFSNGGDFPTRSVTDDDIPSPSPYYRVKATSGTVESHLNSSRMSLSRDDSEYGSSPLRSPINGGYSSKMVDGLVSADGYRSETLAEGSRMLIENLREKIGTLEDKCERTDRERRALNELLTVKKAQLADERERHDEQLDTLNDELQRIKSEKVPNLMDLLVHNKTLFSQFTRLNFNK